LSATQSLVETISLVLLLLLQNSEKVNDPQIGHIIGHSDIPAEKQANLRNVN
jgi:hypothetical protein